MRHPCAAELREALSAPVVRGRRTRILDVGSGPVLLCSSGAASVLWDWLPLVQLLRDRYRVVVVDRPGYAPGDPVTPGLPTLEDEAARLVAVLDTLGVSEPVTAVGHSFGAAVVEATARLHPGRVAGLVLLDGSVPEAEGAEPDVDAARTARRFRRVTLPVVMSRPVELLWRALGPIFFTCSVPGRRRVARALGVRVLPETADQATMTASLRDLVGYRSCMHHLEQLRSSTALPSQLPVLVVAANGRLPRRRPSRWVRHVLRQARELGREAAVTVRVVSRSGHFVMLDRPGRTAELIRVFTAP